MDIMLASVLVLLIVGCVVGYSVRAETASDRPAGPRRRRPFWATYRAGSQLEEPPAGGPAVFLCDRLRLPLPRRTKRT